ncbi:MAG: S9 family peptidase [Bacteroidales bacterium]|nr:S9 family peptidase [Bacteroidales bacterium]
MTTILLAALLQILATRPQQTDGRKITMQEAVMGRLYPAGKAFHWEGRNELREGPSQRQAQPRPLPEEEGAGIVIGQSVSRNEFGISRGVFPSPSGRLQAVYRKDESAVSLFPLLDINTRTGSLRQIRYPMNGMPSEKISLLVCDTLGNVLSTIIPTEFTEERYLTCVSWSPDDKYIFIQVLDRSQHHMVLNQYRASDGSFVRTILKEDNDAWVEPQEPLHFIEGRYEFIYHTDNRDGWRNLYLCDTLGNIRRLTAVDADVKYAGNDGRNVFYTSAEVSPIENHLFRIDLGKYRSVTKARFGKPVRLTPDEGWHSITLSPDCSRFIDSWSSFSVPRKIAVRSSKDGSGELLFEAPDPLEEYAHCEVELGAVPSADGQFTNYYRLYKPLGFDPAKKYPVVVYVYGGPHSQMVRDGWLASVNLWEMLMAQKGYVVYVQDNRGTSNRGAAFEKAINRNCGQAEMADQVAGLRRLMEQPWVDSGRIGVHGWSYGGFMTISLLTNYPDIFKVGVAGGPVIDWKWYEVMYGERYMDTPKTNPEGFEKTSLINKAASLKGKLLICQGAIDDTVVWEHSLSFVQKCIENGVQLDYFPYPRSEHNVRGLWRVHLMDKVTDYFDLYL